MAAISWPDGRSRTRPVLAARLGYTGGRGTRVQRTDKLQQHNEEEEIRHDSNDSVRHSKYSFQTSQYQPLNAELNPICHFLPLLGAHHILHVSRVRVKYNVARLATLVYTVS